MLEIKNLRKSYGALDAVKNLNLTIATGEFFALLGPSGCGKTTLLRMLGGFETPDEGEIHEGGKRVDLLPAHQRRFNMVFQKYALFPHLNVWENVAFGLRMKKVEKSEIDRRVKETLELVKMGDFGPRAISTLSGGQQQRIALARAIVNRPNVLLLDEPLSALDLKLRQQMQVELVSLQRNLKHNFIFVTHDQEEALTLSDRIAVMNNGVIEQVGTGQEIYEYPKTPFVAQFIGTINFLEATVKGTEPGVMTVAGYYKRPWMVKPSRDGVRALPNLSAGTEARMLVRPEKMKVLKSAPAQDQNYVEGTLRDILYQGPLTQLFVQSGEDKVLTVTQSNNAMTSRKTFLQGEKVFVAWAPEDCFLMEKN